MILPPILTLVDFDGYAVPTGEKDIPDVPPADPSDPAAWPAWTDAIFYGTLEDLPPDEDLDVPADGPDAPDAGRSWSAHLGELIAAGRTDAIPSIAGGSPTPTEWAQACDVLRDEPAGFIPTDADLAEMHEHFDGVECRYGYE